MPVVTLKVDEATRELWVEAASRELVTLSEWLRRAADVRLGLADRFVDQPMLIEELSVGGPVVALTTPSGAGESDPEIRPAAPTATPPDLVSVEPLNVEPVAEPPKPGGPPVYPEREFRGPDPRPVSQKKKRR